MTNLAIMKQMYEQMSKTEKEQFLLFLNGQSENQSIKNTPKIKHCPHCNSIHFVKNSFVHGIQRVVCKDCGKTFTYSNNTILFSTKKDLTVWQSFCECLMHKFSIRKSAELCEINTHTAFNWRHKILDVLQNIHNAVKLDRFIEADETFFALSFKGHHKKFKLPREAHKNCNSVHIRGLSQEMVCVPSIVNLDGKSIAKVSNLGKPCFKDLSKVIKDRINKGSIFVTDSFKSYQKVAFENDLTHIRAYPKSIKKIIHMI